MFLSNLHNCSLLEPSQIRGKGYAKERDKGLSTRRVVLERGRQCGVGREENDDEERCSQKVDQEQLYPLWYLKDPMTMRATNDGDDELFLPWKGRNAHIHLGEATAVVHS